MNSLYRALVSLATVLPISIPYVYVFSDQIHALIFTGENAHKVGDMFPVIAVLITVAANFLIGLAIIKFLDVVAHQISERPVKIQTVKVLGSDSLMGYLPYVLPLFISQDDMQGAIGWIIGGIILLILSWVSMTVAFSPLLRLCGLQFYEAQLADGTIATLLVKDRKIRPLKLKAAAYISSYCIYGIR